MPDKKREIPRAKMPSPERDRRSQLAQLAHGAGLLRGTLAIRERVCGKPNCRCTKGQKHVSLYLVASYEGRVRQLFVPKDWEPQVRRWVQQYQKARKLLEEVSLLYWDKVRKRQG
jgi:Family of unknown function (DUF6788)